MAYFNRKDIVRLLAEKPDMISSFPEYVISSKHSDDIERIPDIALCDISMMADSSALDSLFLSRRPDAVLPAVVYCGIERVNWREFDTIVSALKKTLEQKWHVHVLTPVVLGAPLFRSALCLYAEMQSDQQIRQALRCAACFFYRVAAYIPLCKQFSIRTLYLGGCAPCCFKAVDLVQSANLLKYCNILLSGYGIELRMSPSEKAPASFETAGWNGSDAPEFECFVDMPGCDDLSRTVVKDKVLKSFFENFAIPFGANVMSRLLAGYDVEFAASARSFLPAVPAK